jgi:hypothetical protein
MLGRAPKARLEPSASHLAMKKLKKRASFEFTHVRQRRGRQCCDYRAQKPRAFIMLLGGAMAACPIATRAQLVRSTGN